MSSSLPRENPLDKALNKLVDASQVIERRMGVKAAEGKRIDEAFKLLARGVTNGRGVKQQEPYLDFLDVFGHSSEILESHSAQRASVHPL